MGRQVCSQRLTFGFCSSFSTRRDGGESIRWIVHDSMCVIIGGTCADNSMCYRMLVGQIIEKVHDREQSTTSKSETQKREIPSQKERHAGRADCLGLGGPDRRVSERVHRRVGSPKRV